MKCCGCLQETLIHLIPAAESGSFDRRGRHHRVDELAEGETSDNGGSGTDAVRQFDSVRRYYGLLSLSETQKLEFSTSHPSAYTAQQYRGKPASQPPLPQHPSKLSISSSAAALPAHPNPPPVLFEVAFLS